MEAKIKTIYKNDFNFPYLLKNIINCPSKLFVKGNSEILRERCVAIVGTRNCTENGRRNAANLAYVLARKGYVIVSGLANGIDSAAHIGCLRANGRTIAVLAHGLEYIYPNNNVLLANKILKSNGAIISEHNSNTIILKKSFIERNRIISGLCEKTFIVEAGIKSGALSTGNFALEQGREVYAFPGKIDNINYSGTNKLIQCGANIFIDIKLIKNI